MTANYTTNVMAEVILNQPFCCICLESVNVNDFQSLWAPCCKQTWYHSNCLQGLASSQASFLSCAVCYNKEEFASWVARSGIFIPQSVGSNESHFVKMIKCNVEYCLCTHGRDKNTRGTQWELVICNTCDSKAAHKQCAHFSQSTGQWQCRVCQETIQSTTTDYSDDESWSPCKADTVLMSPASDTTELKHIERPYKCSFGDCFATFRLHKYLIKHEAIHRKKRRGGSYKCDFQQCQASFRTILSLKSHKLAHKKNVINTIESSIKCELGDSRDTLRSHYDLKKELGGSYKCDFEKYQASFKTTPDLKVHKLAHKKNVIKKIESSLKCDIGDCFASFKCHRDLNKHKLIHMEKKPGGSYKCDSEYCLASFQTVFRLENHYKAHKRNLSNTIESSIKSDIGDSRATLRSHYDLKNELGGSYECDFEKCQASFKTMADLKVHNLAHKKNVIKTIESSFNCDIGDCFASFRYRSDLKVHKQIHMERKPGGPYKCDSEYCLASFQSVYKLEKHYGAHKRSLSNTIEKSFKCIISDCPATFNCPSDLIRHEEEEEHGGLKGLKSLNLAQSTSIRDTSNSSLKCDFGDCPAKFIYPSDLKRHKEEHGGSDFKNLQSLETDKNVHEPNVSSFQCNVGSCRATFRFKWHFNDHMQIHKKKQHGGSYKCVYEKCEASFKTLKGLIIHRRAHVTTLDVDNRAHEPNVSTAFRCNISSCRATFRSQYYLNRHKQRHKKKRYGGSYKCVFEQCQASFETLKGLIIHRRAHVTTLDVDNRAHEPNVSSTVKTSFKCNYGDCLASFKYPSDLKRHEAKHGGSDLEHRSASFENLQSLEMDNSVHEPNVSSTVKASFECNIGNCRATFRLKRYLQDHKRRKHKIKQHGSSYKCVFEQCQAFFGTLKGLITHKKAHVTMKAYLQCNIGDCLATFKYPSYLKRHKKKHRTSRGGVEIHKKKIIHYKGGPFKCYYKDCNGSFKNLWYLNNHQKIHKKKERVPNCDEPSDVDNSSATLKESSNLAGHQKNCGEAKHYKCKLCVARFKSLNALNGHSQVHKNKKLASVPKFSSQLHHDHTKELQSKPDEINEENRDHQNVQKRNKIEGGPSFYEPSVHKDLQEMEYPCQYTNCYRSFPSRISLNNHCRVHQNKKLASSLLHQDHTKEKEEIIEEDRDPLESDDDFSSANQCSTDDNVYITALFDKVDITNVNFKSLNNCQGENCNTEQDYLAIKPCLVDLSIDNVLVQKPKRHLSEDVFFRQSELSVDPLTSTVYKPFKCAFDGCNEAFILSSLLINHQRDHEDIR